ALVYLLRKIDVRQTIKRRIRDEGDKCVAYSSGFLPCEVDDAWIERHQLVVASPVQRKVFDLLLCNQTGNIGRRGRDRGSLFGDRDLLCDVAYLKRDIHTSLLA